MDRDDRRRYFIVGSVILEIVTPVFRQRLEKDYKSKGLGCLQDFINSKPVIHILFHLRHKNTQCCVDSANCVNHGPLPLNYNQWDLLYTEKPTPGFHHCFCKYSAKAITLDDLDITLASLILMNCCNLSPNEFSLISDLRQFKNNYLSHNTKGAITQAEYTTLFGDLTKYVLQLDPSKQDDFIRIQNRSLDDSLCNKYVVCLLDIHQKLEEIDTRIQNIGAATTADIHSTSSEILSTMNINNAELESKIMAKLEEVLQQLMKNQTSKRVDQPNKPYKLGQSIFTFHHQTDLTSVVGGNSVTDIVMMDDGRLVMCLYGQSRLLICNTDGSQEDSIPVQGIPYRVTAVNNSTIAFTVCSLFFRRLEMYDIHNKLKLKSISVPEMWWNGSDITTINNKLVVGGKKRLLIIDHQTGEVVQTIQTDCIPLRLHGSRDRIFYGETYWSNNKFCWYSYTDDRHHTLTLPSRTMSMTTLQDGSLYVSCGDGSVQHVSSDGKQYKTVKTIGLTSMDGSLYYNCKQRKLFICYHTLNIQIFHEK